MKINKNAFTLIELLAVIVILSIITLIVTPIVLGIINNAKENAFEQSVNGVVGAALTNSILNTKGKDILYEYKDNKWISNKLDIDGSIPRYVEIKVNKKGEVRYAITDGSYCATKEYDSELNIKKIGDENNDKKIQEQYCKLDPVFPTDESCFSFIESNNEITITDYDKSCGTDVIIPEKIDRKSVTIIGDYAFHGNELTNVIIPNSITSIGDYAFRANELTGITIPDTVISIGEWAFADNELTSVIIPSSVMSIGGGVFNSNKLSEEQAYIYNRNSDGSMDYSKIVSYGGKSSGNLEIPAKVNGVELKTIGKFTFSFTNFVSINIPSTVTEIQEGAISYTQINSITIPENVKIIGKQAFYQSPRLTTVIISDSVIKIEEKAFSMAGKLKNVFLGNNLEFIGAGAFSATNLQSIVIPSSVTSIGEYAFSTGKLENVTIQGKSSASDFTNYGTSIFGWASGYSDSNIIWEGSN